MSTGAPKSSDFELAGKVAFVTGAGGELGGAIAAALSDAGANVICADLDEKAANQTAESIGGTAEAVVLDVRDRNSVAAEVDDVVRRHGRLDVMCNVAGVAGNHARIVDLDEDEIDRVINVNLKGVLFGCQAALTAMIPRGSGSIINMSSSAIDVARAGLATYTMTKAGVAALTKVLATEAGPFGVRVNAVAPGWVPTTLTRSSMTRPDGTVDEAALEGMMTRMRELSPLGRVGVPTDVANLFVYLASPASAFMTGQTLCPNGGASMPW